MKSIDIYVISYYMISFGFSSLIYSAGLIPLTYLAILGGFVSLWGAYNDGVFFMLNTVPFLHTSWARRLPSL